VGNREKGAGRREKEGGDGKREAGDKEGVVLVIPALNRDRV
jgi:hypothetical protein